MRFGKDEYDLVTTHAVLNPDGKPIIGEDGTFNSRRTLMRASSSTATNCWIQSLRWGPTYAAPPR